MTYHYLTNPDEIYRQSFKMIDKLVDVSSHSSENAAVIKRMIHACGVAEIVQQIHCHPEFANSAIKALKQSNCNVIGDCEMVLAGIMQKRAPKGTNFFCTLNNNETPELAKSLSTTRSAAAIELWKGEIEQSVIVIGNAPTALFHLIELLENHSEKPAVIIGLPVGFVGAAESKQALIESEINVPFITLKGRMGGSAMASAALNALLLQL